MNKNNPAMRDGNWLDKWGACKICDGEEAFDTAKSHIKRFGDLISYINTL